jgi:hypothetical protein
VIDACKLPFRPNCFDAEPNSAMHNTLQIMQMMIASRTIFIGKGPGRFVSLFGARFMRREIRLAAVQFGR